MGLRARELDPNPQPAIVAHRQQMIDRGITLGIIDRDPLTLGASPETGAGGSLCGPLRLTVGAEINATDIRELLEKKIRVIAEDQGLLVPSLRLGDQRHLPATELQMIVATREAPVDRIHERVLSGVAGSRFLL